MANPPPKIRILPAQLEDASALSMVEWDAYSCDPVSRAMFGEYTPEGSEVRAKEIAEGMAKKDPNTHYIKAVLGDDTIIAVGIWHFYLDEESSKAIEVMDVKTKKWSTGANVDACMDFFGKIYKMRERMRGQRHACKYPFPPIFYLSGFRPFIFGTHLLFCAHSGPFTPFLCPEERRIPGRNTRPSSHST